MRNENRFWKKLLGWILALLLCGAALYGKSAASPRIRELQRAVFGAQPERVEAVFSAIRDGNAAEEVFAFAD